MTFALALVLLAAPTDAGLPDCIDVASVYGHLTLVGIGGPENEHYLAVRELYDGSEGGGGRDAIDCHYEGLAALWDDAIRRTRSGCQAAGVAQTGGGRPGGVRLRFVRAQGEGQYTTVNAQKPPPKSTTEPSFTIYASAFDKKECTSAAASKAALDSAKKFAEAHGLTLEGFKPVPLGNAQVATTACLGAKRPECSQTLTVKVAGRALTVRLELTTLPELLGALERPEQSPEAWSFEVAPSIGSSPSKLVRVASTTFTGMAAGSSWTRLGPCELFTDGGRVVLKLSLLHGFLGMSWEEARFVELL